MVMREHPFLFLTRMLIFFSGDCSWGFSLSELDSIKLGPFENIKGAFVVSIMIESVNRAKMDG